MDHDDPSAPYRDRTPRGKVVSSFEPPLSLEEWDARFPGVLDSVAGIAGAANIILQLARPAVGYGVVESRVHEGNVFRHPWKRARTTFSYLAIAMLGTTDEKLRYREAVNRSHVQVHSTAASKVRYHATDPELQLWVASCLFFGILDTQRKLRGAMPRAQVEELYRRCETLGTTLQVREGMWPRDLAAFEAYWDAQLRALSIDDTVRRYLDSLVEVAMLPRPLRLVLAPPMRFFTVGFLPAELRDAMHYPWSDEDERRFRAALRRISAANRRLPRVIRQAPSILLMHDLRRRMREGAPLV